MVKLTKVLELSAKYAECRLCGSDKIGNGAGKLIADDGEYPNKFHRSCKCGWSVTTDENGKEETK
ncbi:uncharacterized protein DUF3797 [Paenibacillus sp. BK033]|uniref:DUF3797 domain-containing protein n=1 Tax=Paenibacillus sp. BK033 TaxID=2512133 RepID=UPI0010EA7985|nr:DUF3797 domain-containing protein [Paenibacillus sp. BK033]TCN00905.1 uncharacterized protein DUF3797 [Paenibacillus sp. BK033]